MRPPETGNKDFYFSEIETVADSDRTRRILEAREEAKKRKSLEEAENAISRATTPAISSSIYHATQGLGETEQKGNM